MKTNFNVKYQNAEQNFKCFNKEQAITGMNMYLQMLGYNGIDKSKMIVTEVK